MISADERERFDALLEEAIENLPPGIAKLLDEVPVIVLDRPTPELMLELGIPPERHEEEAMMICGLHSGEAFTERSVAHAPEGPNDIHLFREGIIELAGGWDQDEADDILYEEIMVTLLHEIGHQFGLDEDDLERLGYD